MKSHHRNASDVLIQNEEDVMERTQFEFDNETQRVYRELKSELKRLKLETKINEQINRMLSERLSKLTE